jgi:hypothetical protein
VNLYGSTWGFLFDSKGFVNRVKYLLAQAINQNAFGEIAEVTFVDWIASI